MNSTTLVWLNNISKQTWSFVTKYKLTLFKKVKNVFIFYFISFSIYSNKLLSIMHSREEFIENVNDNFVLEILQAHTHKPTVWYIGILKLSITIIIKNKEE